MPIEYNGEEEEFVFSTGRRQGANLGIIGLSPELEVADGYDGWLYQKDRPNQLTDEECIELADYMIELWRHFRNQHLP